MLTLRGHTDQVHSVTFSPDGNRIASGSLEDEDAFVEREYRRCLFDWAAKQVRRGFEESTWQAFWQTSVEGSSTKEVAESLGMTVGAVYIARSRVLARLKEKIQQVEG